MKEGEKRTRDMTKPLMTTNIIDIYFKRLVSSHLNKLHVELKDQTKILISKS